MPGNDAYTKLLLHCDGADASTTFTDSSASAHTVTRNGNAQIDTAQSKFGGASGLFDGTGDSLSLDGSADFAFGTGDFTIDFWLRLTAGDSILYDSRPISTSGVYPVIYLGAGAGNLTPIYFTNSADRITGSALSTGVWYHIALARSGTDTKMFVDGAQVGSTYTDSNDYLNGAARPAIGAQGYTLGSFSLNGWLDEFRVSKGIARWTANFTPPAAAYGSIIPIVQRQYRQRWAA